MANNCAHANSRFWPEKVVTRIGSRFVTYERQGLICTDCGDVIVVPTPGLVVDEMLALFSDEGQNAFNQWGMKQVFDAGLASLENTVARAMERVQAKPAMALDEEIEVFTGS